MLLTPIRRDQDACKGKLPQGVRQKVLGDGRKTLAVGSTVEATTRKDKAIAVYNDDRERSTQTADYADNALAKREAAEQAHSDGLTGSKL